MRVPMGGDVLHPYVGFVGDPTTDRSINTFGFFGGNPIHRRSESTVIIGVVGGSVAQGFATMGMPVVERVLRRRPEFRDKQFIVVNLARGGFKQPQQLMALNYMLLLGAEFDIVINFDGFNEVALHEAENAMHNVFPAFPRVWFMLVDPVPDRALLRASGTMQHAQQRMVDLARRFSEGPWRFSMLANLVWDWRRASVAAEYLAATRQIARYTEQAELRTNTMMHKYRPDSSPAVQGVREPTPYWVSGPRIPFGSDADRYRFLADVWKHSSVQIHRLCRGNDSLYLHFLQPNQYVAGTKPMGSAERAVAYNPQQPYRPGVERGYPLLLEAGRELVERGVPFVDLTSLFAGIEQPIYIDDCCHYNRSGYEMIGVRVAQEIAGRFATR